MTLRHRLPLIVGFALFSSPSGFTQSLTALSLDRLAQAVAALVDEEVAADVLSRIKQSGAEVGVAFRTLDGKTEWFSRADDVFHAASTMKLPVMIELFHQVREDKAKLEDPLVVKNEFHSLADGSPYTLDPADDSETDLYKAVGQTRTLNQLCELMITVSSNLATNLLAEKLGVDNIRATVHALHADGMNVLRGVEDNKAYEKGMNNTTTARGLLILLQALAKGEAVDTDSSRQMVEILARQKFNEAIPAGLPPRYARGTQNRGGHQDSSRRGDCLRAATVRPGDCGAWVGGIQRQRGTYGGHYPKDLSVEPINTSLFPNCDIKSTRMSTARARSSGQ